MAELNMIKLQHFFEVDSRIKKEMYNNIVPADYYDTNSLIKYTDILDDSLSYIFSELKCVSQDIFGEESIALKRVEYLEKQIKQSFYACGLDVNKLKEFYKNYISNMDLAFINEVKKNCVGQYIHANPPINSANTINEYLHLLHAYVVNNDNILESMPLIAEKENDNNQRITLRGEPVEVFNEFFNLFPSSLDVGWTEILSLGNNRLIMMIRDRGHATTLEITVHNDKVRIEYFIPKICNINMVNSLPGINPVDENSIGATGVFETELDNFYESVYDFISKVPTDLDMEYDYSR